MHTHRKIQQHKNLFKPIHEFQSKSEMFVLFFVVQMPFSRRFDNVKKLDSLLFVTVNCNVNDYNRVVANRIERETQNTEQKYMSHREYFV